MLEKTAIGKSQTKVIRVLFVYQKNMYYTLNGAWQSDVFLPHADVVLMVSNQSPATRYKRAQRDIGKTISEIYNRTTHFRDLRWNLTCDRTANQCVRVSCRWTLVAGRRTDGWGGGNGIAGIVVGYSGRCATTTIARVPNADAAQPSVRRRRRRR